jgi:hypothetical protein
MAWSMIYWWAMRYSNPRPLVPENFTKCSKFNNLDFLTLQIDAKCDIK